jgi:hypothetical protein
VAHVTGGAANALKRAWSTVVADYQLRKIARDRNVRASLS